MWKFCEQGETNKDKTTNPNKNKELMAQEVGKLITSESQLVFCSF